MRGVAASASEQPPIRGYCSLSLSYPATPAVDAVASLANWIGRHRFLVQLTAFRTRNAPYIGHSRITSHTAFNWEEAPLILLFVLSQYPQRLVSYETSQFESIAAAPNPPLCTIAA